MMVAKAMVSDKAILPPMKVISGNEVGQLGSEIGALLEKRGHDYAYASLPLESVDPNAVYIAMDDGDEPLLINATNEQFQYFTRLRTQRPQLLWISSPAISDSTNNHKTGLITGLARTVRAENEALRFVILEIQQLSTSPAETLISVNLKILESSFGDTPGIPQANEIEYTYRDGYYKFHGWSQM
jgi:hypothetical protein